MTLNYPSLDRARGPRFSFPAIGSTLEGKSQRVHADLSRPAITLTGTAVLEWGHGEKADWRPRESGDALGGKGFHVQSVFDYNGLGRELSPFLLLDYGAATEFSPGSERRGEGEHPHRGFETVTLAYQGEVQHRDSSGGGGKIGPGDVQWMTAAGAIVHKEFHSPEFTRSGGSMQMAQLWVNLPVKHKNAPPAYQTLLKADIPNVPLARIPGRSGSSRVNTAAPLARRGR